MSIIGLIRLSAVEKHIVLQEWWILVTEEVSIIGLIRLSAEEKHIVLQEWWILVTEVVSIIGLKNCQL